MRLVYDLIPDLQAQVLAARTYFGANNTLRDYFPVRNVEDIRYRLAQRVNVDPVGAVRSFDTPSRQVRRGRMLTVQGELPAVSAIDTMSESDLIRARQLAGTEFSGLIGDQVRDSAATVAVAIDNTYELLRGQAFSTGAIAIDNGGVIQGVDFGVGNRWTAGDFWDDPDSNPIADLEAWTDDYADKSDSGTRPAVAVTSRRVWSTMLRHPAVVALFGINGTAPALITPQALNTLLASYDLPEFRTYDRKVDGERTTADNTITFLPDDGPVGETLLGVTEQAVELAGAGVLTAAQTPGVTIATLVNDHPISRHVNGDALGMPVLTRPNDVGYATVLAA